MTGKVMMYIDLVLAKATTDINATLVSNNGTAKPAKSKTLRQAVTMKEKNVEFEKDYYNRKDVENSDNLVIKEH